MDPPSIFAADRIAHDRFALLVELSDLSFAFGV